MVKGSKVNKFKYDIKTLVVPRGLPELIKEHYPNKCFSDKWYFYAAFLFSYLHQNKERARVSNDILNLLFSKHHSEYKTIFKQLNLIEKTSNHSTTWRKCAEFKICDKVVLEKYVIPQKLYESKWYKTFFERYSAGKFMKEDVNTAKLWENHQFRLESKRKKKGDTQNAIKKIKDKSFKGLRMDESCRVHSVFTNSPKGYRKQMTYNGEKLVEIDVKSCQPLLLSALYGDCHTHKGKKNILKKKKLKRSEAMERDKFLTFMNRTVDFYKEIGISKKSFGFAMFGTMNEMTWRGLKLIKFLKKNFPILHYRVKMLRDLYGGKKFARLLQRWESYLMIDGVLKNATFGAISIHDGILVAKENMHEALKLMGETFKKLLNIESLRVRIGRRHKRLYMFEVPSENFC